MAARQRNAQLGGATQVNGPATQDAYRFLRSQTADAPIEWNYSKFIVGRDGQVLENYTRIATFFVCFSDAARGSKAVPGVPHV